MLRVVEGVPYQDQGAEVEALNLGVEVEQEVPYQEGEEGVEVPYQVVAEEGVEVPYQGGAEVVEVLYQVDQEEGEEQWSQPQVEVAGEGEVVEDEIRLPQ